MRKLYTYLIGGNKVTITKEYRTVSQYEYYLKIYMGDSNTESIRIYREMHLTKKAALEQAKHAIFNAPQPRIEKVIWN